VKLFYKDTHICDITTTGGDFPWVHGNIIKHSEYEKYKDFFAFLVSRNRKAGEERKFNMELFDENNWTIKDGEETICIFEPHIYDETNEIGFRYR